MKKPLQEMFTVSFRKPEEVATLLHTTAPKIKAGILNGTLPIGFVAEGGERGVDRTVIVEARLEAWLNAEDLKGVRRLSAKNQV